MDVLDWRFFIFVLALDFYVGSSFHSPLSNSFYFFHYRFLVHQEHISDTTAEDFSARNPSFFTTSFRHSFHVMALPTLPLLPLPCSRCYR